MEYFFRHTPDSGFSFNMHLVRLGLLLFLRIIYKFKDKKAILPSLLLASVIFQGVLIFWYTGDSKLFLTEGLPLYHCRIAGVMMPLAYILGNKKIQTYFSYLAIVGTLVAFAIPDPSKYSWPHVTNLTYIVNHYILIACGMLIATSSTTRLKKSEIISLSLIMNFIIYLVDIKIGANYGYLIQVPIKALADVPSPLVFIAMTGLISLVLILIEGYQRKIKERELNLSLSND